MKKSRFLAGLLSGVMTCSMVISGSALLTQNITFAADGVETEVTENSRNRLPYEDPENTQKSDEIAVIALTSEPAYAFDTAAGAQANEAQLIENALMEKLVNYNFVTKTVEPNLASEWEWLDGTHLQLKLRDDILMGDGTPLVADDVVYTCNELWVALNGANDTGKHIVSAVADDEHTVTIEWTDEAPDYIELLTWPSMGILTEEEVEAAGGLEAIAVNPVVGNGKYKFDSWAHGESLTIVRNEDYWNDEYAGYFKTIKFVFIADPAAKVMGVEAGDVDVAYEIPVSLAATFMENPNVQTSIYSPSSGISHLWYNMGESAGATKDENVRKAIDLALNFDAISYIATAGYSAQVKSYFDSTCPFYEEVYTDEDRAVNIEAAKECLKEAGYENGLDLRGVTLSKNADIFTVIQANLAEIGINLTVETPDTGAYVQCVMGGDYDIMMAGDACATRTPATVMPTLQMSTVNSVSFGGPKWTTEEIDSLITALIVEKDLAKATEIATKLANIIKDHAICSNLYQEKTGTIFSNDIKGFGTLVRGYLDVTRLYK